MKVLLISANTGQINFLTLLEKLGDKMDLSGLPGLYLPGQTSRSESEYIKSLSDITLPLPASHLSTPSTLKDQKILMAIRFFSVIFPIRKLAHNFEAVANI